MKNIAIIPARSGSKGLKNKNIKELCGVPLLIYSCWAAQESDLFDEIMVSTDSKEYAEIVQKYGFSVPFLRSAEYSGDTAGSWEVVQEVLKQYDLLGKRFDTVCLLQPTSPLRTAEDIKNGYVFLESKRANAITAVCEVDHSPLWSTILPEDLSLTKFRENLGIQGPRQNLDTFYRINGALYIRRIEYIDNKIDVLSNREYAYIMERKRSIDIDTELDFEMAEIIFKSLTQA